jgi:solute carrier family 26 (sodium-independent sulfate anion transporter), member 11
VEDAPPGIIVYRFEESFLFPNASYLNDRIVYFAEEKTRRGKSSQYRTLGDRPWNEGFVPRSMAKYWQNQDDDVRPILRAIVLDFSAVANVDSTSVQSLIDTRQQLEKYADRQVEFHFAAVLSPWVRRALVAGGFGVGNPTHRIVEVAPINATGLGAEDPNLDPEGQFQRRRTKHDIKDPEAQDYIGEIPEADGGGRTYDPDVLPVAPTNFPFFHLDIDDAVKAAEKIPE